MPQAYLAFGDATYLGMFKEVYAAAMTNLQLDPNWNGNVWCACACVCACPSAWRCW